MWSELLMVAAAVIILLLIVVLVILLKRGRTAPGELPAFLLTRLEALQSGLKEDFLLNRAESAMLAKDNRAELALAIRELKQELTQSLEQAARDNRETLRQLIGTIDENSRTARESLSSGIKEFMAAEKIRGDELSALLQFAGGRTTEQLEKINGQMEARLSALAKQDKEDSQLMRQSLEQALDRFGEKFDRSVQSFNALQKEKFGQLQQQQVLMTESNEKKLEEMRNTVDEKLQKTLNERLGQSFEMVSRQLESVQKGLGEMQHLAQDVGGLKRVLSNVKMRGGIGEVQLAMLLEQLLAPDQYAANVKTKVDASELVEFAIRLPGRDENKSVVWLPVDAKFPKDVYEKLQDAYEKGEPAEIEAASKIMEQVIKKMAKDIRDKYIDPPNTTDFAIMFLPFEGIYAEVVRKASLLDVLQREYKVIVTGPTTLAAILNSLQMGFRTMALQQRSSEVWNILAGVKAEFGKFSGLMEKAQKNIQLASSQMDELIGKRTRAITRKLQDITDLPQAVRAPELPAVSTGENGSDDN
jgi:DNA recombination protein RmuC